MRYWEVVACPRLFPDRFGDQLVLWSRLPPWTPLLSMRGWTSGPMFRFLMIAEIGIGRSRAEIVESFCPNRPDILLYVDAEVQVRLPPFIPVPFLLFAERHGNAPRYLSRACSRFTPHSAFSNFRLAFLPLSEIWLVLGLPSKHSTSCALHAVQIGLHSQNSS